MAGELDDITLEPISWIARGLMHTRDTLAAMAVVQERYAMRTTEDCTKFVRVGWMQGSDDQSRLRPFILVELPQGEQAAVRVAEVTFLVDYTVSVLLTDRARYPGQDGLIDWCNFVGLVVDGLLVRQRDASGGVCRIREIMVEMGQRTDPDMDGTEPGHPGSQARIEAYWVARLTIKYGPT